MPGELEPVEGDSVEPAGEPFAQLRGPHRIVEAREVDDVDAPPSGQQLEHRRPPSPRPGEPVDEHERLSGAGNSVAHGQAVDLDFVDLGRHLTQSGRCLHAPRT
jgi:hypothetical protein